MKNTRVLTFQTARALWLPTSAMSTVRRWAASALMVGVCHAGMALHKVSAQEAKPYIRKLEYYKYANISIFEADAAATKRFREKFTPTPQKTPAIEQAEQDCPTAEDIKKKIKNKQAVPQTLIDEAPTECEAVKNYYQLVASTVQIGKVYVITEKYQDGSEPVIIGTVAIPVLAPAQASDPEALKNALNAPLGSGVLDANDLRALPTKEKEQSQDPNNPGEVFINGSIESTSYSNMYEYIKQMIKQSPQDQVNKIRPAQTVTMKINKEVVTKMLTEDKVGDYLYITEGEPHKVQNVQGERTFMDEVVIGIPDYFSWRHYQDPASAEGDPTGLPQYGVELKAGLDDIGYPSLWSERWVASALWGGQKLGVILPTDLWNGQFIKPIFSLDRRFTHGPAGLAGTFDFPFKLIDRSGVFNVSGSYAFGENVRRTNYGQVIESRTERVMTPGMPARDSIIPTKRVDNFIRAHGQFNYTFAIGINDPDREEQVYYIRFKVGGAGYLIQQYVNTMLSPQEMQENPTYSASDRQGADGTVGSRFVFSPLFRIEYMGTGLSVPFGAYVQYFDQAISGQVWLQVPIAPEGFLTGIRGEGRIFAPVARPANPWEASTVITASVRFILRW